MRDSVRDADRDRLGLAALDALLEFERDGLGVRENVRDIDTLANSVDVVLAEREGDLDGVAALAVLAVCGLGGPLIAMLRGSRDMDCSVASSTNGAASAIRTRPWATLTLHTEASTGAHSAASEPAQAA